MLRHMFCLPMKANTQPRKTDRLGGQGQLCTGRKGRHEKGRHEKGRHDKGRREKGRHDKGRQ
jgi:hypothetical protein